VKAITQKFVPIHQIMYFDVMELLPVPESLDLENEGQTGDFLSTQIYFPAEQMAMYSRYSSTSIVLGCELTERLHNCNLFMIGAGAIGCELLKNYAMLGLGVGPKGAIFLTDPDIIEVSNLNRQFLFREKHLRKPKSQTAAAAAIQMNP